MKSVRLNSYLRECILESVLREFESNYFKSRSVLKCSSHKGFKDALAELKGKRVSLLWDKLYGKHRKDIEQCPEWARSDSTQLQVSLELDSSKMFSGFTEGLPCSRASVDAVLTQDEWETYLGEYYRVKKEGDAYEKEKRDLRREVKPIIDSFGSTKQLIETWPSMEKFLPANIADPDKGVALPALSLSRLEEKINGSN